MHGDVLCCVVVCYDLVYSVVLCCVSLIVWCGVMSYVWLYDMLLCRSMAGVVVYWYALCFMSLCFISATPHNMHHITAQHNIT